MARFGVTHERAGKLYFSFHHTHITIESMEKKWNRFLQWVALKCQSSVFGKMRKIAVSLLAMTGRLFQIDFQVSDLFNSGRMGRIGHHIISLWVRISAPCLEDSLNHQKFCVYGTAPRYHGVFWYLASGQRVAM